MREVIERLRVRKNAPPPPVAQLRPEIEALEERIRLDEEFVAELAANITLLNPQEEAELAKLETLLPSKRRKLAALREEIERAQEREAIATFEADRAELNRATEKAAKTFRHRYEKAAAEMVAVLSELRDSHDTWESMARRGRELGVVAPGGAHLEKRVRGDQIAGSTARLLWPEARLFGWNGVPIWSR